jgi:hypothetical protein
MSVYSQRSSYLSTADHQIPNASMKSFERFRILAAVGLLISSEPIVHAQFSVPRQWNDQLLGAISRDFARPPIHARNLFHTSAAMYDAWAAYVPTADPYLLGRVRGTYSCAFNGVAIPIDPVAKVAAQEEAISFAVYRILLQRFQNSPGFGTTLPLLNGLMDQLGYDRTNTSLDYVGGGPAELGNYIASEYIAFGFTDGSNQANNYANVHYTPFNPPIAVEQPGNPNMVDPNLWQQISLTNAFDQAGNPVAGTPAAIGHNWGQVVPFALDPAQATMNFRGGHPYPVYHDPGPPTYLDTTDASGLESFYKWNFILVSIWQSHLDPNDPTMVDISPASMGNLPGYPDPQDRDAFRDFYDLFGGGIPSPGHALNPATGQPYEPQIVKRGDYARIVAEYWADGPASVTPPGHWFKIMHDAMDHPQFERRWLGEGDVLSDLDYDVKAHFVMGGAMHDAAMTAWSIKGWYDYVRPVSAIRYMSERGQCSDPQLPNFHPAGLPIIPGYVEQVQVGDPLAGSNNEHVGKMKLYTWKGPEYIDNAEEDFAGVDWILAERWWPYQRPWFVTPPFAGYISGHSTYSSTAAQVMELITGDLFFPGGMRVIQCPQNDFLEFEVGPSEDVTLQWATYRDASDQCSLSRIWGGIHPPMDDIAGRHIGIVVGSDAVQLGNALVSSDRPVVTAISVSDEVLNIADIGTTLSLTISYDREMDTSVDPVVSFLVEDPLVEALGLVSVEWTSDDQYTLVFSVLASELRMEQIRMRVTNGVALGGAAQDVHLVARPFVIDTDRPFVLSINNPSPVLNDALATTGSIDVMIAFNEACETAQVPVIMLNGSGDPVNSISWDVAGSAWVDALNYRARFALADANEEIDFVSLEISGVADRAGNGQQAHVAAPFITVDTRGPALAAVQVNNDMLSLVNVGNSALTVTLLFDEEMNTSLTPDLSFIGADPVGSALSPEPFNSLWLDANTYRISYTLLNSGQEFFSLAAALSGSEDLVGNGYDGPELLDIFTIDTKRPEVQQLVPLVSVVSDASVGSAGFHVDVVYPEPMRTDLPVLVQLTGPAQVAATLTSNTAASGWVDESTYRAAFNVSDQNVEVEGIGVSVSFARDLSGNTQVPFTASAVFDLDTRNPVLLVLTANTYTVSNSNMGSEGFVLVAVFDEPMDEAVDPSLEFSVVLDDVLTTSPSGSGWLSASTYRFAFDVANIEASHGSVDVTVADARDLAGNPVQLVLAEDFFSIDLQNVGMADLSRNAGFVLFPNPLSGGQVLQMLLGEDLMNADLSMFNAQGSLVHREYLGTITHGVRSLSMPGLSSGVYHVRLNVDGSVRTSSLVVQDP